LLIAEQLGRGLTPADVPGEEHTSHDTLVDEICGVEGRLHTTSAISSVVRALCCKIGLLAACTKKDTPTEYESKEFDGCNRHSLHSLGRYRW